MPRAKREDFKSNRSISLKNIITNSPHKRRAGKASKKSPKKKLKIGPAEPLASNKTSRQKGKAAIITKTNKEVIIKKLQPKWKIKCSYYSETPVALIEALNSKKKLKGGVFSVL